MTTSSPWEPSAWMREALARRKTQINTATVGMVPATQTVVTPIGNWSILDKDTREDRTCDRCRVYVPPTAPDAPPRFFIGAVNMRRRDGLKALVPFGLCRRCRNAEGWPA